MKRGNYHTKDMDYNGIVPFYACKYNNPIGVHSKFTIEHSDYYLLFILSGGSQNNLNGDFVGLGKTFLVNGKSAYVSDVCSMIPQNNNFLVKYVFYYLTYNKTELAKKAHFTTNIGHISMNDLKSYNLKIPPLTIQQQIVDYCDANQKIIDLLEAEIKANKELSKNYLASVLGLQQTDPNEYSASAENLTDSEVSPEIESPAKKQKQ
jgi:restriction endonuclease S subunit